MNLYQSIEFKMKKMNWDKTGSLSALGVKIWSRSRYKDNIVLLFTQWETG